MTATIIPFPCRKPRPAGSKGASPTPESTYSDFTPREEEIYLLLKQEIIERLSSQDD